MKSSSHQLHLRSTMLMYQKSSEFYPHEFYINPHRLSLREDFLPAPSTITMYTEIPRYNPQSGILLYLLYNIWTRLGVLTWLIITVPCDIYSIYLIIYLSYRMTFSIYNGLIREWHHHKLRSICHLLGPPPPAHLLTSQEHNLHYSFSGPSHYLTSPNKVNSVFLMEMMSLYSCTSSSKELLLLPLSFPKHSEGSSVTYYLKICDPFLCSYGQYVHNSYPFVITGKNQVLEIWTVCLLVNCHTFFGVKLL